MKRFISALFGFFLIGIVIFFGIKSGENSKYIVLFGLASALVAPIGVSALGYSIKKEDQTLKKLTLVAEIDDLIEKAETEADKIEHLKREKEELLNYIKNDTKRIAKMEQKRILEEDAKRILKEYKKVTLELEILGEYEPNTENMSAEIKELYEIQKRVHKPDNMQETMLLLFGVDKLLAEANNYSSAIAEMIVDSLNLFIVTNIRRISNIIRNLFKTK